MKRDEKKAEKRNAYESLPVKFSNPLPGQRTFIARFITTLILDIVLIYILYEAIL